MPMIGALIDVPGLVLLCLIALTAALWCLLVHAPAKRTPTGADARLSRIRPSDIWEWLFHNPGRFLITTFLTICAAGGLLLALPMCSATGQNVGWLDALFTAVSATCVTGLIVLDTPGDFSVVGQAVILLLIQVGGLGIMTFYAAAALLLRQRLSIREEITAAELLGSKGSSGLRTALKGILIVTGAAELAGALVLTWAFHQAGDAPMQALWRGIFTAISAYCNAGFALQADSLIPYQKLPLVLHTVAMLIAIGGLGPVVVLALPDLIMRRRVSLHARLVLIVSAIFLVIPAGLFAAMEWSNTLASMTVWERLSNAWFQSVTTRTAGFNALDQAALHPGSLALTMSLMFIGGSPGSMAGGIKTTTAALLFLTAIATLRGQNDVAAFGWRIPRRSIYKAATTLVLSALGAGAALMALLLTQYLSFHVALFEIVSALSLVGLSLGGTALLDDVGKILIMLCMFTGRVGMLTLLLSFSEGRSTHSTLPEQDVIVG